MNNLIILLSIVTQIYGSIHISNINYSLASELLFETVDKTIRPCENFYQFTCNKWIRNEILKPGVDRVFRNTRAHFEFYDEFFYKILHGKKEAETEATKIIKFIVRRCTTEYYIQNIENINIDAAYQQCLDKYELFASYAFHTTILNCIFGYEKILQLNSTIHEMFEMLKNEFKLLVREKDWVDLESRRRINEKIKDMDLEVTYD
uniref:Peptidase_M13_N domain-containing protein n=1 Tax=Parastrongyloides trichosuri TaxID=131310 RepID=A0A0N4ZW45_PARTI